jgi:hypothetical protein
MNEEEMNKEMCDLQEINLELEILTQTTKLHEQITDELLERIEETFVVMATLTNPRD